MTKGEITLDAPGKKSSIKWFSMHCKGETLLFFFYSSFPYTALSHLYLLGSDRHKILCYCFLIDTVSQARIGNVQVSTVKIDCIAQL